MINKIKMFVCFVVLGLSPALSADVVQGIKNQVQAYQERPTHRAEILVDLMFKFHAFGDVPLAKAARDANVPFPGKFEATSNIVPRDPNTRTIIQSWDGAIAFFREHYNFGGSSFDAYADARTRVERVTTWPLSASIPSMGEHKEHDRLAWSMERRLVQSAAQDAVDKMNMPAIRALLAEESYKSHLQNKFVMREGIATPLFYVMTYLSNLGLENEILS